MSEEMEVARIVITRTITEEGGDRHDVEASEMTLVEALGMLRLAEDACIQHPEVLGGGDDE